MDLPVERQIRWIVRHVASLLELGAEPVRGLVQPNGAFFPDRFDGSPAAVAALLARVLDHAGLAHVKAEVAIVAPDGQAKVVSCSSGACGGPGKIDTKLDRVQQLDDGSYRVGLSAGEVGNPVVLTTTLVRAVAVIFLKEADGYADVDAREREPFTDLAAVMLGFGALIANGSHLYVKGCGQPQVHSATKMKVGEVALALAIFCTLFDVDSRTAMRSLDPTQREYFDEAVAWARSNASVVKMVRANPRAIENDVYRLSPARSWLSRTLSFGKKRPVPGEDMDELEEALLAAPVSSSRPVDAKKRARLEELRALVDESLDT